MKVRDSHWPTGHFPRAMHFRAINFENKLNIENRQRSMPATSMNWSHQSDKLINILLAISFVDATIASSHVWLSIDERLTTLLLPDRAVDGNEHWTHGVA